MARTPLETVLFWFSVASFRIKKTDAATGPFHHAIRIPSRLNRRASSRESASSGISIHGWSFGSYSGVFVSSGMADPFFQIFSISGITSCPRIPDIEGEHQGEQNCFLVQSVHFGFCIPFRSSLHPSHSKVIRFQKIPQSDMADRACGIIHIVICNQNLLSGIVQSVESVEFPLICFLVDNAVGHLDQETETAGRSFSFRFFHGEPFTPSLC